MVRICALAAALLLVFSTVTFAQDVQKVEREKTYLAVKNLFAQGDSFMVVEYLNGQSEPLAVARKYADLVKDFYWKDKNIFRVIVLARAGIQYCTDRATQAKASYPEQAKDLLSLAKNMAYDLGSFTWTGWDEKGIEIGPSETAIGFDAALLNLRLARQLGKPAIKVSHAYWLIGAQHLSRNSFDKAEKSFTSAKSKAEEADDRKFAVLCDGYIGIAKILSGDGQSGRQLLEEAAGKLESTGNKNDKFFADQLKSVLKYFKKSRGQTG